MADTTNIFNHVLLCTTVWYVITYAYYVLCHNLMYGQTKVSYTRQGPLDGPLLFLESGLVTAPADSLCLGMVMIIMYPKPQEH